MSYGTVNCDVVQSSIAGVSLGAGNATLLKNRLIDAGFIINQRGYVSNTALSAGTYAHDRWKAGASGCTYTFTQGSAGVPIVITITAGSLQQVIEGCNIPDGGTFTLSWTGTAQGRVNGGTYGSSPLAVTGLTAGANCTVEFNTGTLSFPQLEVGSSSTGFEYRQYQQELALCQRYYIKMTGSASNPCIGVGTQPSTTVVTGNIPIPVPLRTTNPTITGAFSATDGFAYNQGVTITGYDAMTNSISFGGTIPANGAAGRATLFVLNSSSSSVGFSSEL